jgi:hypothetical protein
VRVELAVCRQDLTKRTEALMRARATMLELQQQVEDGRVSM